MTHLTLLLLVDALRHDALARMPRLAARAARGRIGALREDFGFVPRAAYFGGLGPSAYGFTNMYCRDPQRSPFAIARALPAGPHADRFADRYGARAFVEADARGKVPPYAATYISTAEIPLGLVPEFDLAERRAPWDRRVGYRSIFHELDDRGLRHETLAWPETNRLADHSDRGLCREALARIDPLCRFAFVHLQDLDGIAHAFGPEAREVLVKLEELDDLLDDLLGRLESRFDRLDLVLFGDHGMVPVIGTTDPWGALARAGLENGRGFLAFFDSTMARFWFDDVRLRAAVTDALGGLRGHILDGDELDRLDLSGCDPRNGELIFLADPGVLVLPNFFQRDGRPVKGMHGYHPDCPDNQGLFFARDADATGRLDAGVVRPTAIYAELCRSLGLTAAPHDDAAGAPPVDGRATAPLRYTQHPDPAAAALVDAHMRRVVDEARRAVPGATTILLNGSFGRNEGGVTRDALGALHPVNDYDVLVVAPHGPAAQSSHLRELGTTLAREFGTDFVHFSVWPTLDASLPLTLANFDIRYGSQVLWGDASVLDALPRFAAGDLPLAEGVQLLFNRLAGILTALPWPGAAAPANETAHRYLLNQIMKALMALGDWQLLRDGAYACSYQTRATRVAWLAAGWNLPADQRAAIDLAYRYKLHPDSVAPPDLVAFGHRTSAWLVAAIVEAVRALTHRPVASVTDAAAAYYAVTTEDAAHVALDNAFAATTLAARAATAVAAAPPRSVRQTIYASFPRFAAAAAGDADAFAAAAADLQQCFAEPWPPSLERASWEASRQRLADIWLTLVH